MYEQTADWPSARSFHESVADTLGQVPVLRVRGMVSRPLTLTYGDIVDMACFDRFGGFAVSLPDLLARCELAVESDLLVAATYTTRSTLLAVRDALSQPASLLMVRGATGRSASDDDFLLRLDAPALSASTGLPTVTSIEATTFQAFVR